jgi:hypothetical protein
MSTLPFVSGLNVIPGAGGAPRSRLAPWRPAEWGRPALTAITVGGVYHPATTSVIGNGLGGTLPGAPSLISSAVPQTPPTLYVFDAVLKVEHTRELRRTEHPIQPSPGSPVASITDHAFQLPPRVVLEIGMSDAMESYSTGLWSGDASKSVSAYHTLVNLLETRALVILTTRLWTYTDMLIESIRPSDTVKTRHGLRATVVFSQVFLAQVGQTSVDTGPVVSARPQATGSTPVGTVQPATPADSLVQQHDVTEMPSLSDLLPSSAGPSSSAPSSSAPPSSSVPGAGNWSSINITSV